jgi:hypothetical protein
MSIFSSFRAGSGDYQAVRPLTLTISPVSSGAYSVEQYSKALANITNGSVADCDVDSIYTAQLASPNAASVNGLLILDAYFATAGVLTLVWFNPTGSTITPAASTQVNLLQF